MSLDTETYFQANRQLWDRWTEIHIQSEFYDVEGFKRGRSTLDPIEIAELTDVAGKSLLHLQCHFGQDTLSWARLGANVTGADFSPKAIEYARTLATDLGINARFVCADLYDLPDALGETFDIVYTGGGAITWLPDLRRWGRVVSHFLKPGGTLYLREFHPIAYLFDDDDPALKVKYPYFARPEPISLATQGSYADPGADFQAVEYTWVHSLSDIINAVAQNGMRIEWMNEFADCGFQMLPFMEKNERGLWELTDKTKSVPFTYSIRAIKDATG